MAFQINMFSWSGMVFAAFEKTYTFVVGRHLGAFEIISSLVLGWRHLRKNIYLCGGMAFGI